MKQIKGSFKIVLAVFLLLIILPLKGTAMTTENNDSLLQRMDSVEISLLTVGPGNEVWSLYGHTALRYQDFQRHQDLAVNYGAFSFEQDFFILRFVFGATDYEMETIPMRLFMDVYESENRWVLEQKLNLTRDEKLAITDALSQNSLPENVSYRYNFFYDNCTTRARYMIINHLNATIEEPGYQWNNESYREMIHQWTEKHRWTRFGNDLLLGIGSDFKTEREASFFLPDSVRKDFSLMTLTRPDGKKSPLVSEEDWLINPQKEPVLSVAEKITPRMVFGTMFLIIFLLSLMQWLSNRNLWWLDLILLLTSGIAGIILLIMVFSQHPTVRVNLQILILNPLSLFLIYSTVKASRQKSKWWYWKFLAVCIVLFLIGGFWQTYAEGMYFVALSLLLRCIVNIRYEK